MTTQTCQTLIPGGQICGDPADHVVAAGCVHEHVDSDPICDWHWQRMQEGNLRCPHCWRSSDPHQCAVIGRVTS